MEGSRPMRATALLFARSRSWCSEDVAPLLIWRSRCQGLDFTGWIAARVSSAEEAAVLAGARRAVKLIYADWVPQDRISS